MRSRTLGYDRDPDRADRRDADDARLVQPPRPGASARVFATPEDAVRALVEAVKAGTAEGVVALFGSDAQELADSSIRRPRVEIATCSRSRPPKEWQLIDQGSDRKVLVIGNEEWPFPVPLAKDASGWRFDTAAGKEEVLDRRIGRNELAVIRICRTYVAAQRLYSERGHDRTAAGIVCQNVLERSGSRERTLLVLGAWSEAQSAR